MGGIGRPRGIFTDVQVTPCIVVLAPVSCFKDRISSTYEQVLLSTLATKHERVQTVSVGIWSEDLCVMVNASRGWRLGCDVNRVAFGQELVEPEREKRSANLVLHLAASIEKDGDALFGLDIRTPAGFHEGG